MADTYWLKQTPDKPLFPDTLWSRPENRRQAGKLFIAGGQAQNFSVPSTAYGAALKAGVGVAKVLLPDSTQEALGRSFSEAEFAPSTPSGSFSRQALDQFLELAQWADGVLLAGDFGHNSETAILLESFAQKYQGQLTLAGDSLDYFMASDSPLLRRAKTTSIIDIAGLQKLGKQSGAGKPVLHKMSLHELVETLHDWTTATKGAIITRHSDQIVVAFEGQVSSTPGLKNPSWETELAAYASVWWLQQPRKLFEALTSTAFEYQK